MYEPLIGVIIPVYNAEDRLKDSIESVLNPDYKQMELILIDDGSSDNSFEICKKYQKNDKRVKVYHKENSGVSSARNYDIDVSTGEYITFVDADDTIEKDAYISVISIMVKMNLDMVIYGMNFDYYQGGKIVKSKKFETGNYFIKEINVLKDYFYTLYNNNYLSSVWNKVIKASVLKVNNFYFERDRAILEDFKYVLEHTKMIGIMNNSFYHYYNNIEESSLKRRENIDYLNNFKVLDNRLRSFVKDLNLNTVKNSSYKRFKASINNKENIEVYNDEAISKYRSSHI